MSNEISGFDWDEGNFLKNREKHGVSHFEAEQVFFNQPLLVYHDRKHSKKEPRWFALGRSDAHRELMLVFTLRSNKIRVISGRPMSRRERKAYEKES